MSAPSLVFIGDVHNRVKILGKAIDIVPEGASLAFVGDFMNMRDPKFAQTSLVQPQQVLDVHTNLIEYLNSIDATCFYVLGNHDPLALKGRLGSQWINLDLEMHDLPGTDFTLGGVGGSHMVPPQLPGDKVRRFIEEIVPGAPTGVYVKKGYAEYCVLIAGKPYTILSRIPTELSTYLANPPTLLLTHTPPVLPSDDPFSMEILHLKSMGLARAIEAIKPSYVVSGHLHEPRPLFYEKIFKNAFHTACMQTGELNPEIPLWAMDFGCSRSIPEPRRLKWR